MGYLDIILWLLGILYVLTCGFLLLIVLIQEGKSGGLSQADSVSQAPGAMSETFGAGGAQKSLYQWTSVAAAMFFGLALLLTIIGSQKERAGGNIELEDAPAAQTAPAGAIDELPPAEAEDVDPE